MKNRIPAILISIVLGASLFSCSPKNISTNYYYQNKRVLDSIEIAFKSLSAPRPFTIGFTSKDFQTVSVEIITDTMTYVYEFSHNEPRLYDTLKRYGLNADAITRLIDQMYGIKCTWIKNQDYYVDDKKNTLVFMSIRPVALSGGPFTYKRYYVLTYFQQPQYFDSEGRLLDKRKKRRLRKINGEIFKRINDRVCYTISGKFR